jgi:osmoprotectant transport system permease protein
VDAAKQQPVSNNASEVYEQARKLMTQDNLVFLSPMKYNNTYTLSVKENFANQLNPVT